MYTFGQTDCSKQNADHWSSISSQNKSKAFTCITDTLNYLNGTYEHETISVLVAGSLHLVGEVLRSIKSPVKWCWYTIYRIFKIKIFFIEISKYQNKFHSFISKKQCDSLVWLKRKKLNFRFMSWIHKQFPHWKKNKLVNLNETTKCHLFCQRTNKFYQHRTNSSIYFRKLYLFWHIIYAGKICCFFVSIH